MPALKKAIKSNWLGQTVFISFDWDVILAARKMFPGRPCYWLCYNRDELFAKIEQCAENKLNGVNLSYGIIDQDVMDKASSLGLEVLAWTVNDPIEARRLLELGVAAITTDRPGWLREQLR